MHDAFRHSDEDLSYERHIKISECVSDCTPIFGIFND